MSVGKRLAIYTFYDKDGIADRYVDYFLQGISEIANKLIIVANGVITPQTRGMFSRYTSDIIVRENEGFDAWGYKAGLEHEGYCRLRQYYEVILVNNTVLGPVYPFSEMFAKMDENTDLDFWGITRHMKIDFDPFRCNPYGYIPEHIQSFFMVFRNRFLQAEAFRAYWEHLPALHSYDDTVGKHETVFTKHFAELGFQWSTYVDNTPEKEFTDHYILVAPQQAIEKYRCPIFKRRIFFQEQEYYLSQTAGEQSVALFQYLQKHTAYDTDMILENLIRTCHQADFVRTLALSYILPADTLMSETKIKGKTALIMHVHDENQVACALRYAFSMPTDADIYVLTSQKLLLEGISKLFSALPNLCEVRLAQGKGEPESSLLLEAKDVVNRYDYICFYHDEKNTQVLPRSVANSAHSKSVESALHNREYVCNILSLMENNPKIGMLSALPPNHGHYYSTLSKEWGANFKNTEALAVELELHVPMTPEKPPVASFGASFWFRTAAMQKLFQKNWQYSDFSPERQPSDGTLLQAIKCVYSFVVQDAGYYPANVMPDFIAAIELANFTHYTRAANFALTSRGISGLQAQMISTMEARLDRMAALEQETAKNVEMIQSITAELAEKDRCISELMQRDGLKAQLKRWAKRHMPFFHNH